MYGRRYNWYQTEKDQLKRVSRQAGFGLNDSEDRRSYK